MDGEVAAAAVNVRARVTRPLGSGGSYIRQGLGPGSAARVEIPVTAPRALDKRAQIRYLRAVETLLKSQDLR
jgi:hypothetical protein